ncbi:MAG: glutamine-hydrolyzing carbamoyl-phosphate synthase small subunit [Clostridia bacterium]|nr:glutamine-hydrolyzing carbamoyl-phosphate synthase small subunit [Clostridia bacterium]
MGKAYLVLANGNVFEGTSFGAEGNTAGELVFTTSVVGYIETLTDPTYAGQIIMQTFPLIGNYGIIESDFESENCYAAGFVVREYCEAPSNFRCEKSLEEFMKERGIIGICGVDTREITKIIRENGVMKAKIVTDLADVDSVVEDFDYSNLVQSVGLRDPYFVSAEGEEKFKVALIDCGAKKSQIKNLTKHGMSVNVFPYNVKAEEILNGGFDGVVISNGPGNPNDYNEIVNEIKKLVGNKPIFGIGLGHQLLALAFGGKVEKILYGHRGGNQPVKDLKNGKVAMTTQNHNFVVDAESVKSAGGELRLVNINDNTCEGVDYPEHKAISVQHHPEANNGLRDSEENPYIRFTKLMGGAR